MIKESNNAAGRSNHKWIVVGLLSLGMVIAYIHRLNLSVVLALEEVKQLFQFTDELRGMLNSAFFWSYALFQIPAGWVVDRYGVKYPYALSFVVWCLATAACGLIQTIWQLMVLRILLGMGQAIVAPASLRWIRFNCREEERGLAVGIYLAGTKLGSAIGAPLIAWCVVQFGWRGMFVFIGVVALLWLLPWLFMARDAELPATQSSVPATTDEIRFVDILKAPAVWGILIGTFAYNYFAYFCLTWLPAYFVEQRGLSLAEMARYTGYAFGGMAVVATAAGWVADRIIARGYDAVTVRKAFTITGLLLASSELIGAISPSESVALFFAVFSLSGLGVATANYWVLTQILIPGKAIGRIVGVQNTASNLSGIISPILTGWLLSISGSYKAPMLAIFAVLLIGIASYAFLVRREYAPILQGANSKV